MFTFRTPIFFDADDGGGAGEPLAPGADPSLGSPSPDEQTFTSEADFRAARSQFVSSAPPVIETPEPEPEVDDTDALLTEIAGEPASTPTQAPAAPAQPAPAADQFVLGHDEQGRPIQVSREQAYNAWQVQEALRTEAGVRALVAQGLTALGYSPAQIRDFVAQQNAAGAPESAPAAPAAADPLSSIEDDDLITGADLKKIVGGLVQQAVSQSQQLVQERVEPLAHSWEERVKQEAQVAANATYTELLGAPPAQDDPAYAGWMARAQDIQRKASQFVAEDNWNPADIRAALIRAHALHEAEQEELFKAYARAKKADRAAQPANIRGGASASEGPAPEPKNTAEARDIFFREQGIIR